MVDLFLFNFSELYGPDYRCDYIDEYKTQNNDVISILDEIAHKRAEIVNKTPFDSYDDLSLTSNRWPLKSYLCANTEQS